MKLLHVTADAATQHPVGTKVHGPSKVDAAALKASGGRPLAHKVQHQPRQPASHEVRSQPSKPLCSRNK